MKTAIKLILIYFAMQVLGILLVSPLMLLYAHLADAHDVHTLVPSLIAGMLLMMAYLYKKGYLTGDPDLFRHVGATFLAWSVVAGCSCICLLEELMGLLDFLPDWMDMAFDEIVASPWGILSICLLGPVLEEMLFRGAVTKVLLRRYRPGVAIVLSALLFGLFHINPVQVVAASCSGLLLAWLYWRTGSLWPSIAVHVINNSFSVFLMRTLPDVEHLSELYTPAERALLLVAAVVLLALSLFAMNRGRLTATTSPQSID